MASSRTGTAVWRRNRATLIAQGQANGLTHCQGYETADGTQTTCGNELDYTKPLQPNSVEIDHILEYRYGGSDRIENLRILCRKCNLQRNRITPETVKTNNDDFPILGKW